mmetsp:Transcript_24209/g.60614  ORF Transcript_24209/g.60614 Transcript_24209/m.60614 type:complete len:213 (-) Transcript_24209:1534-2172(-)
MCPSSSSSLHPVACTLQRAPSPPSRPTHATAGCSCLSAPSPPESPSPSASTSWTWRPTLSPPLWRCRPMWSPLSQPSCWTLPLTPATSVCGCLSAALVCSPSTPPARTSLPTLSAITWTRPPSSAGRPSLSLARAAASSASRITPSISLPRARPTPATSYSPSISKPPLCRRWRAAPTLCCPALCVPCSSATRRTTSCMPGRSPRRNHPRTL